jgi:hypothetical protein
MENLEKVELVREKCNVSYEEARDALEACDYDVLDAIVMLERASEKTARFVEAVPIEDEAEYESIPDPETGPAETEGKTSRFGAAWKRFCTRSKELCNYGMETNFIAERNGEYVFELPLLLVIIGLLLWGASLWLLVIGLFLGFRYRIEGRGKVVDGVNDAMGKVADAADSVKQTVA